MPKGWLMLLGAALLQTVAHGSEILISLTNQVWRYDQSGVNSPAFRERFFDDSTWPEGRSILAYEHSAGVAALNYNVYPYTNTVLLPPTAAPLAPNHTVDFFRTRFMFTGPENPDTWVLTLSNLVDDAYVAYLNGVEVDRFNMNPADDMLAATTAPQGEGVYFVRRLCIPPGTLVHGENVLAVRVHQNTGDSADVVWGTVLHASPGSAPAILSPTADVNLLLRPGNNTNLVVAVQAAPCATYQWFKNNQPILGATIPARAITNMDATQAGTYFLRCVNAVGTADSPRFLVTYADDVTPPRVLSATADFSDLSVITLTFSEDVTDLLSDPPFDPLSFYIENRGSPGGNIIGSAAVSYGSSSNVATVILAEPRDPSILYQLVIATHGIEDLFGNPMPDPTIIAVTTPTIFQDGRDGYMGTQDTEVRFSMPDSAAGGQAATILTDRADGSPSGPVHSLVRFDNFAGHGPLQIPYGAMINKALLRIYTDDQGSSPARVMRMLTDWDESSTWNSMANGIDETNGVEAVEINTVDCSNEGTPRVFDDIDVTGTVQAWVNGQPNYGFAFLPRDADGWRWVASENATVTDRPALIVDYWYDPAPCSIVEQPRNVTVPERQPFSLSVVVTGSALYYQWYKNGVAIPGADSATYTVNRAQPADQGDYYVLVQNDIPAACVSATATVTVCCPPPPPRLISALGNLDSTTISLQFDSTLDPASAQNASNYMISGGLNVIGATYLGSTVTLTSDRPRQLGRNYTVTIANVRDDAAAANLIYPNPTIATLTQEVRVLSFDAVWKYENSGTDLGTAWRHPHYNDLAWPQGPGLLGFETGVGTLVALSNQNLSIGTQLTRSTPSGQPIVTDYFRTLVNVPFDIWQATFTLRHVVDDGAVFYFNGTEVARFNMATGVVNSTTRAVIAPTEGLVRSITNVTGLACGLNSVAVEVHQQSEISNDLLFGAELIARVPFFPVPECYGGPSILRNADGTITLYWMSPMAVLQETDELGGEWRNVLEAINTWTVTPAGASRFYRVR